MMNYVIEIYKNRLYKKIVLGVLADNPGAIKLYQNLGFEQISAIFIMFNNLNNDKPFLFSMTVDLE